jgi:succinate dehydrogenase/fumarate reductase flavoprotein subunit
MELFSTNVVKANQKLADVVVVGYGAAGAVAAIEAARSGVKVLLVEKMPDPGGISALSAGGLRICFDSQEAFLYMPWRREC